MGLVRLWLVLLMAASLSIACSRGGDDGDDPTATTNPPSPTLTTAVDVATASSTPIEATATLTSTPEASATAPIRPAATTAPTVTATSTDALDAEVSLELVTQGFSEIQSYDEVAFGFIVENPDGVNAVVNSEYTVTVYDGDVELESDSGYLDYVLPGQRLGVGGSIFIPEGRDADSIVIELTAGEAVSPDLDPGFSVTGITYYPDSLFPSATAVISTSADYPLQDFEVFAVGYDEAGSIIGGGYTFVSFILPGGSTGVEVNLSSVDEPARVELYPVVTSLTVYGINDPSFDNALPLEIVQDGFGVSSFEGELGWGFIAENPNTDLAAETTAYQVTAYAADNTVLGVYSSYISLLLPGERLGLGGSFYVPSGKAAERLEFEILGRYFSETLLQAGVLTSSGAAFVADEFSPQVTGTIINSVTRDLSAVEVYALAYDADGQIIGGGFTFVDMIEAEGQADVEMTIAVGEDPAMVELFATVSSLSDIE